VYETWRNYFENVAIKKPTQDWRFSQEDVLVSLVWGSQVLQQVAQKVRSAENKIVTAEKLAAMAKFYAATPWPESTLDEAWRTLLLSEHHDCWIVPYNLHDGRTWANHIATWTDGTKKTSRKLMQKSTAVLSPNLNEGQTYVRVFNTLGTERRVVASVALPADWGDAPARILDDKKIELPSQIVSQSGSNAKEILFPADVPSMGYNTYRLEKAPTPAAIGASASIQADGTCKLETDSYKIILDPSKGGVIKSLLAKELNNKEFVDVTNARSFDEIRGYFYNDGKFHSSADNPAKVTILENGPIRVKVAIEGMISSHPFVELITVAQEQKRIDLHLKIDWQGNPGIGSEYCQAAGWRQEDNRKAFYDERYKLLALFPLNLQSQKVYKNAPFDVTESKLTNTFFTTWDGIKNDIILNWVDVADASNNYGLALLTDHTTSYAHGTDFPLGLTLQYSGMGLWGRNYRITGPLDVIYAIIPHAGSWDHAEIWTESDSWNQPLVAAIMNASPDLSDYRKSLIDVTGTGLEVPAVMFQGNDLIVRIFNAEGNAATKEIIYNGNARKVQLVELNGEVAGDLKMQKNKTGGNIVTVTLPRFGIRTIRFSDAGI
jgi:alpha-mannosidase